MESKLKLRTLISLMICKGKLDLKEPIERIYRVVKEKSNFSFDINDLSEALEDTIIDNEEARIGFNEIRELEDF